MTEDRAEGLARSAPHVRMRRADNPSPMTLDGTRTFVIGADRPVVIDPGPPDERHLEALLELLAGSAPVAILLTHAHLDHAGCAERLARRTGAPIGMGRGARRLPFPAERVSLWLSDGDVVASDGGPVRAVATPGHAPEHLAYLHVHGSSRALFVGDLFLGAGDTTLVSHPEGEVSSYLQSLHVVTSIDPTVIFPAHGPPLENPTDAVARYRAHRLERIEEVRRAREEAPHAGPEALVDRVYGGALDPRLRAAAAGSVKAILTFLDRKRETGERE